MIAGVVVVAAFLAVMLRQQRPEQAMAVSLAAGIGILALVLSKALPVIGTLRELLSTAALPEEYGAILFKALGICLPSWPPTPVRMRENPRWHPRRSWRAS